MVAFLLNIFFSYFLFVDAATLTVQLKKSNTPVFMKSFIFKKIFGVNGLAKETGKEMNKCVHAGWNSRRMCQGKDQE